MTPRWPIWLFAGTIVAALVSGAATFAYYYLTARVQEQEQQLQRVKGLYEKEVEELQGRLIVEKLTFKEIETPVTTTRQECLKFPFGQMVCRPVPQVKLEKTQVPVLAKGEDPAVKKELDAKLKALQELSSKAVTTQSRQIDAKAIVDTTRQLVAPFLSLIIAIAALRIVLSNKYKAESEKWAFGTLGTILGYWLK